MSILVVTLADGSKAEHNETIGHQIGNGAVQVMNRDGTQVIYNNFSKVEILLDAEEKALFLKTIEKAEKSAQDKIDAQEKNIGIEKGKQLAVVPKH